MSDELVNPLAIHLYAAHAASRRLKTKWHDLSSEDVQHWRFVALAALSWAENHLEEEEATIG